MINLSSHVVAISEIKIRAVKEEIMGQNSLLYHDLISKYILEFNEFVIVCRLKNIWTIFLFKFVMSVTFIFLFKAMS